jgi:hypothetical protein
VVIDEEALQNPMIVVKGAKEVAVEALSKYTDAGAHTQTEWQCAHA